MENWLFVDFQTLGLDPSSAVLSVGLLYVPDNLENYTEDSLMSMGEHFCFDVNKQNRPIDKDTLSYWRMQPKEDLKCFEGYKNTVDEVFNEICIYLRRERNNVKFSKNDKVWSKGMIDKFFFQSLFSKFPAEIQHYQWRDSSTALDVLTGSPNGTIKNEEFKIKNNALYNCVMEYKRLREALKLYE